MSLRRNHILFPNGRGVRQASAEYPANLEYFRLFLSTHQSRHLSRVGKRTIACRRIRHNHFRSGETLLRQAERIRQC